MSEILHNFLVVYAGEILTGIVVAVVSVAASHIFYRFKLRKEQKVRFQDVIGEKIANALLAVWDIERKAHNQEIYDIEKRLDEEQVSFLNPEGVYLAIMSDSNAFLEFVFEINDVSGDYEKYLSDEVAAHLWYGSSRFMEMANFIAREGMVNHYPEMGTIFLFDILNWRDSLEKAIVRDINRHSTKVVAHRGKKWEKAKEKLQEKLHKKNVLNELINNPNGEEARMLYLFIDGCNGVQREHNKKLNNGLPILHKVPPKRDYGRYFCIMAEKGGTSHGGLTEKLTPFFMPKNRR